LHQGDRALSRWAKQCKVELYFLSKMYHDNIIKFYGEFWLKVPERGILPEKPNCILVKTELMQTNLGKVFDVGPMPPNVIVRIAKQMASALQFMHARGVAHHDVKQTNVMIAEKVD